MVLQTRGEDPETARPPNEDTPADSRISERLLKVGAGNRWPGSERGRLPPEVLDAARRVWADAERLLPRGYWRDAMALACIYAAYGDTGNRIPYARFRDTFVPDICRGRWIKLLKIIGNGSGRSISHITDACEAIAPNLECPAPEKPASRPQKTAKPFAAGRELGGAKSGAALLAVRSAASPRHAARVGAKRGVESLNVLAAQNGIVPPRRRLVHKRTILGRALLHLLDGPLSAFEMRDILDVGTRCGREQLRLAAHRMRRYRFVEGTGGQIALTRQGRWQAIATVLGIGTVELAILSGLYLQAALMLPVAGSGVCRRDGRLNDIIDQVYGRTRYAWKNLCQAGHLSSGKQRFVLQISDTTLERLRPYRHDVLLLRDAVFAAGETLRYVQRAVDPTIDGIGR